MTSDLETLRTEIEEHLKTQEFAVFHGYPRLVEPSQMVHWDVEAYPDYEAFLETARRLGVVMVVFHHRKLSADFIEDVLDQLDAADLPDEEYVELQRRLREMRVFEGFTSVVELTYEYEGRVYFYTKRADWYEELLDIADEIDDYTTGEDDEDLDDEEGDIGPYFSKN